MDFDINSQPATDERNHKSIGMSRQLVYLFWFCFNALAWFGRIR